MSLVTITFIRCNGCHLDTWRDEIDIEWSKELPSGRQLDLCSNCMEVKGLCPFCDEIHSYDDICEAEELAQEAMEKELTRAVTQ